MRTLNLGLGARSYDIHIGEDIFGEVAAHIPLKKAYIVTDENVAALHLEKLEKILSEGGIETTSKVLPAGEKTKSYTNLEAVTDWLLENKVERKSTVIAFGGGVIGDLVGFAASVTLRGINFIQIPTTVLAQVDSSVGGKTAINSKHGKNLVGAFYQPKLVVADLTMIDTLPPREFLSGYAEIVKYGLINDKKFFNWLDTNLLETKENLMQAIYKSCESKAGIVAEDELEGGKRALLNLGHTFGHALEAETGFSDKLLHGEAVAIGTVMAFKFSHMLELCESEEVDKVIAHFEKANLPTDPKKYLSDWDVDKLVSHMYSDKKVSNGKLVFILVRAIGEAFVKKDVSETSLREFLESY